MPYIYRMNIMHENSNKILQRWCYLFTSPECSIREYQLFHMHCLLCMLWGIHMPGIAKLQRWGHSVVATERAHLI